MKYLIILPILLLSACSTPPAQVLTKTEVKVIVPDKSMFYCPKIESFPDSKTLTDRQVARLIVGLHKNNIDCHRSMNNLYLFLEAARKRAEG